MKLLLDTHTFLWWESEPARLSDRALRLCVNPAFELLLSVASLWEFQIKRQLGKLKLARPLAEIVEHQQSTNGLSILPVTQDKSWLSTIYRSFTRIHSIACWWPAPSRSRPFS